MHEYQVLIPVHGISGITSLLVFGKFITWIFFQHGSSMQIRNNKTWKLELVEFVVISWVGNDDDGDFHQCFHYTCTSHTTKLLGGLGGILVSLEPSVWWGENKLFIPLWSLDSNDMRMEINDFFHCGFWMTHDKWMKMTYSIVVPLCPIMSRKYNELNPLWSLCTIVSREYNELIPLWCHYAQ